MVRAHLSYSTVQIRCTNVTNDILAYFLGLGIPDDEATELHHKYYTQYGLALRGLARHHNVGEAFIFYLNFNVSLTRLPTTCRPARLRRQM